ncbi:MAG: hypothetical protein IPM56_16220 [Ignavibacteriales bacterium]|nr:MAG: hypothetical protein IPM56_16220 [Ignavibacteriales bacterium]
MSLTLPAQTVVSDSGTIVFDQKYSVMTYSGTIKGTDTVKLKPVIPVNVGDLLDVQYYFQSATDSAKVTVKRQESYWADQWKDVKTIVTGDTGDVYIAVRDTIKTFPSATRPVLIGVTGNGYTTTFKAKLVFKKE